MVRTSLPPPDPKPAKRVRDKELLKHLHFVWRECALCHTTGKLSLHHIHKHPRDDVKGNLVMLCGDGVQGCHGRIESHHGPTVKRLMQHIINARPDTVSYLMVTMGAEAASEWIRQQY